MKVKACFSCRYVSPEICAVNPAHISKFACADFEATRLSEKAESKARLLVGSNSFSIHLLAFDTDVYVRALYWENFRYNTEGVEFLDSESLGVRKEEVPSSLIRQTAVEYLPTLGEFLEKYFSGEEVLLGGIPIKARTPEVPLPPKSEPEIWIGIFRGDECVGDSFVPVDRYRSYVQAIEQQGFNSMIFTEEEE